MEAKSIKIRLTVMNFMQFFIWGSWLISLGGYMMNKLHFSGLEVGAVYGTMGIASLFMPGLLGIVADRWLKAEKLVALCHLLGAILLFYACYVTNYALFYPVMLGISMMYMPTIALTNTIAYNAMNRAHMDIVKEFPPIRVWGTVGFICAMWLVDLTGAGISNLQLYIASAASIAMALYTIIFVPSCPPQASKKEGKRSILSMLGLDALSLFKDHKMAVFFIFSMLLGAALQVTNTFGNPYLHSFESNPEFAGSFAVNHPNVLLSLSQMSETLFILAIPFVLGKFGIKRVMALSLFAWVARFGLFAIGDPGTPGFIFLVLSMIVYGMAFDFFNISGSMFVENETTPEIRAGAQGLFVIMTNGLGATIGGVASGWVVDLFTHKTIVNGVEQSVVDWQPVWLIFAAYALVVGIAFLFAFRYKEDGLKIKTKN